MSVTPEPPMPGRTEAPKPAEQVIIDRKVTSAQGAAIKVTTLTVSEETAKALSTGVSKLGPIR